MQDNSHSGYKENPDSEDGFNLVVFERGQVGENHRGT